MLSITAETPTAARPIDPDVADLLRLGDEFALSLYPAESYYGLDLAALAKPGVTLFVARNDDIAVGTAALVIDADGAAELKRMFVATTARGLGVAGRLLAAVEAAAAGAGVTVLRLETGPKQPAAIALYEKHGYTHIPRFGQYVGDESSVCMEKVLLVEEPPLVE